MLAAATVTVYSSLRDRGCRRVAVLHDGEVFGHGLAPSTMSSRSPGFHANVSLPAPPRTASTSIASNVARSTLKSIVLSAPTSASRGRGLVGSGAERRRDQTARERRPASDH